MRGQKADRCWQKGKGKGGKEDWEEGKVDPKERDGPKENGQTLVTRGTVLVPFQLARQKRKVLRWIRGKLLDLFQIFVQSF